MLNEKNRLPRVSTEFSDDELEKFQRNYAEGREKIIEEMRSRAVESENLALLCKVMAFESVTQVSYDTVGEVRIGGQNSSVESISSYTVLTVEPQIDVPVRRIIYGDKLSLKRDQMINAYIRFEKERLPIRLAKLNYASNSEDWDMPDAIEGFQRDHKGFFIYASRELNVEERVLRIDELLGDEVVGIYRFKGYGEE